MIVAALMLAVAASATPADKPAEGAHKAKAVAALFGYPSFKPESVETTRNGGWVVKTSEATLRIDSLGRPREFRIAHLKFEMSDSRRAIRKGVAVAIALHEKLPPGAWVTDDVHGRGLSLRNASRSMRYYYMPSSKGHPFLDRLVGDAQFSSDLRQVREWLWEPVRLPSVELPAHTLSRGKAAGIMKRFCADVLRRYSGRLESRITGTTPMELGWIGKSPRLVYEAEYFVGPLDTGRRAIICLRFVVDAATGEIVGSPWPSGHAP